MSQRPRPASLVSTLLLVLLLLPTAQATADSAQRIVWQKTPVPIDLRVGQERQVDFPAPVELGLPAGRKPDLRVQSIGQTVYLLAHHPFATTRVLARSLESGSVYLLDLSAQHSESNLPPVRLVEPPQAADADTPDNPGTVPTPRHGYVALTRFAAQQLYAPTRLLQGLPGVVRVPVARDSVALVRGGDVSAVPQVAWRAGDRYLTAARLQNQSAAPVTLDPRKLRGQWLTATFQHGRLLPHGDTADTTAVYLISDRPFAAALR